MDELTVSELGRVRPIFQDIDIHRPTVFTVLEGTQAGRVFANRRDHPSAALIWSDACYVGGDPTDVAFNADLLELLRAEVMPCAEHVLIYAFTDAWRDRLDDLLQAYDVRRVQRTVFDWDPALFADRGRRSSPSMGRTTTAPAARWTT